MGLFVLGPTSSLTLGQRTTLPLLIFYYTGPTNKNIASGLGCLRYMFICIGPTSSLTLRQRFTPLPPPPCFYYRDPQIKILSRVPGVFDKGLLVLGPTASLTLGERVTPPSLIFIIKILPQVSSIWVYSYWDPPLP